MNLAIKTIVVLKGSRGSRNTHFATLTRALRKLGSIETAIIQSPSASLIFPRDIRVAARLL